jgi:hypothetical protein
MKTLVDQIVDQGRRPRELRRKLRAGASAIKSMLSEIRRLRSLRASVPNDVLGGDLVGMLSDRMRKLLEERAEATVGDRSSRVSDEDRSNSREIGGPTSSLASLISPNKTRPQLEECVAGSAASVASEITQPRKLNRPKDQPCESLLERKLREYWELVTHERTTESAELAPRAAANGGSRAGESVYLSAPQSKWSWDEFAASTLKRNGRWPAPLQSRMTPPSTNGSEEATENPRANPMSGSAAGEVDPTDEDLSERLSEILLEQAMQHGIDVT